MTEKDREIQELRRKVEIMERQLQKVVEAYRMCGLCKWLDADCSPTDCVCHPEWVGVNSKY